MRKVIVDAAATIPAIADVHDITILKTEKEKRFITLHCSFQEDVLMEDVHELTSRLEGLFIRPFLWPAGSSSMPSLSEAENRDAFPPSLLRERQS